MVQELVSKVRTIKAKLKRRLFNNEHKKPIPRFPKNRNLNCQYWCRNQRYSIYNKQQISFGRKIQISTLVQGTQAKEDIIKNIKYADSLGVDTIIVGRGGGSIEDLWNFNEEDVVKAIFECQTPIISAVGHETDFTLSDFVADVRAATPTQAAVMATPDQYELMQQIKQYQFSLSRYIKQYLENNIKQLDHLASYYKFKQPSLLYDQQIQRKDDLEKTTNSIIIIQN